MTFAPPTLLELAQFWTDHGGVNLGIVGDADHAAKGYSYHLGKDQLVDGAYSAKTARDRAGLSNAASAIDLGRLGGTLAGLAAFSRWLVQQGRANAPGTSDIREVIYTPDGQVVLRWDRERGYASEPRAGEADDSHLTHTHVSFYRDAELRDHTTAIRRYFMDQMTVTDETPKLITTAAGTTWYELDGKTVASPGAGHAALAPRISPCARGSFREIFASVGGVRRTVLVKPATVVPIPSDLERVKTAAITAIEGVS